MTLYYMYICSERLFGERLVCLIRNRAMTGCPSIARKIFAGMTFAGKAFAGKHICRKRHMPERTFAGKDICRKGHLPEKVILIFFCQLTNYRNY